MSHPCVSEHHAQRMEESCPLSIAVVMYLLFFMGTDQFVFVMNFIFVLCEWILVTFVNILIQGDFIFLYKFGLLLFFNIFCVPFCFDVIKKI